MNTAAAPEAAAEPLAVVPTSTAGDEAFAAFYTATFPHLAGYVRGLVGEEQAARDLAQEVTDPNPLFRLCSG